MDVEKINEVEAEGDKPLDQSALLVEPPIIESSKAIANETSRKGKRKSNTEKVRCDKCLREFNPAYLSRHICKPCVVTSSETSNEPIVEEPRPASETPPIPLPIIRETTAIM